MTIIIQVIIDCILRGKVFTIKMAGHVIIILFLLLTLPEPVRADMVANENLSEKVLETVILEDGRIYRGNFHGEKDGTIEFLTENGKTELINKKDILRVLYENLTDEEAREVYKEEIARKKQEEPKTMPEKVISDRVYFRNGSIMLGKVLSQKRDFVVLQAKDGREVKLNKDNILRLKFRVEEMPGEQLPEVSAAEITGDDETGKSAAVKEESGGQAAGNTGQRPDVAENRSNEMPQETAAGEKVNNGILQETVYLKDGSTVMGTINHGSSIISVTTPDQKIIEIDKKNILRIDFAIVE